MAQVLLSDIKIPPSRQRSDLPNIESLAESIRRIGQLQAIVIDSDYTLLAGGRRCAATRHLGLTHIEATFRQDLSPEEAELIELAENTEREDLSWQDKVRARLRISRLIRNREPEITGEDLADRLHMSRQHMVNTLTLGEFLEANPDSEIAQLPSAVTAYNSISRQVARQVDVELETILGPATIQPPSLGPAQVSLELESIIEGLEATPEPILNLDFIKWAAEYSGPRFNLVHCDFPYGIDHQKSEQGGLAGARGGSGLAVYSDTKEVYWELVEAFITNSDRFLATSAHVVFWFSMKHYSATVERFTRAGFSVNPTPLIWFKSDNTGILPDPQRGPRQIYETALLMSCGDRKVVRAVGNCKAHSGSKDDMIHHSEKPREMLTHFLGMLCDESTSFLDPTAGSGNAIISAKSLGASLVLGLELDPEICSQANQRYRSTL